MVGANVSMLFCLSTSSLKWPSLRVFVDWKANLSYTRLLHKIRKSYNSFGFWYCWGSIWNYIKYSSNKPIVLSIGILTGSNNILNKQYTISDGTVFSSTTELLPFVLLIAGGAERIRQRLSWRFISSNLRLVRVKDFFTALLLFEFV